MKEYRVVIRKLEKLLEDDKMSPEKLERMAKLLEKFSDKIDPNDPELQKLAAALEAGEVEGTPVDTTALHSPLPRAYEWIDGSAYINHIVLVRKARNAEPPATLETDPLVYQGGSGVLLAPTEDIRVPNFDWGVDFEAEIAVILGDTPRGVTKEEADEIKAKLEGAGATVEIK